MSLGEVHEGQYHLGPVDFAESEWHNACAPTGGYRAELRAATGLGAEWLAGVSMELSGNGALCDACIAIETATGNSLVARVVINPWWTSLWVRNPRLPVTQVAVQVAGSSRYTELRRASDGTFTADAGFGEGAFSLRVTALDGQTTTQSFASFMPGTVVTADMQFE